MTEGLLLIPDDMVEIPCKVNGTNVRVIFDTGAGPNVASRFYVQQIRGLYIEPATNYVRLRSAFGKVVVVSQQVRVPLTLLPTNTVSRAQNTIATDVVFLIADGFPYDLLVGTRFMREHDVWINVAKNTVILQNRCLIRGDRPSAVGDNDWLPTPHEIFLFRQLPSLQDVVSPDIHEKYMKRRQVKIEPDPTTFSNHSSPINAPGDSTSSDGSGVLTHVKSILKNKTKDKSFPNKTKAYPKKTIRFQAAAGDVSTDGGTDDSPPPKTKTKTKKKTLGCGYSKERNVNETNERDERNERTKTRRNVREKDANEDAEDDDEDYERGNDDDDSDESGIDNVRGVKTKKCYEPTTARDAKNVCFEKPRYESNEARDARRAGGSRQRDHTRESETRGPTSESGPSAARGGSHRRGTRREKGPDAPSGRRHRVNATRFVAAHLTEGEEENLKGKDFIDFEASEEDSREEEQYRSRRRQQKLTSKFDPFSHKPIPRALETCENDSNKQVMYCYSSCSRESPLLASSGEFHTICRDAMRFVDAAVEQGNLELTGNDCFLIVDEEVVSMLSHADEAACPVATVSTGQAGADSEATSSNEQAGAAPSPARQSVGDAGETSADRDDCQPDVLKPTQEMTGGPLPVATEPTEQAGEDSVATSSAMQARERNPPKKEAAIQFGPDISEEEKKLMTDLFLSFSAAMSKGQFDVGETEMLEHDIDTGTAAPIALSPHRINHSQREELWRQLQILIEIGFIRESTSPWAAPIVLVRKKDGSWRLCIDHRELNKVTKKDATPLPRIDDVYDQLAGSQYFTTLDFCCGYYNVRLGKESREKTAFTTPFGLFEWTRMTFGLCNAPATFQRLMNRILKEALGKFVMCYLDDIIIYSKSFETHLENTRWVLANVQEAGLKLKMSKCVAAAKSLTYLGSRISADGVATDPDKVKAVAEWKFPLPDEKAVKAFLGLVGYYRKFIKNFAHDAFPLTKLTRLGEPFVMGPDQEAAFESLKLKLVTAPILGHADFSQPFLIYTDASGYGVGAILKQIDGQGRERVIAYASRTLQPLEMKYPTTHKECLAIIFGIEQFRYYVFGQKFSVVTDHHSLCYLMKVRKPYGRLTHWALRLQEFDFDIVYKPGVSHKDADALSRYPIGYEDLKERSEVDFDEDVRDMCARTSLIPLEKMDQVEDERRRGWQMPQAAVDLQAQGVPTAAPSDPTDGNPPAYGVAPDDRLTTDTGEEPAVVYLMTINDSADDDCHPTPAPRRRKDGDASGSQHPTMRPDGHGVRVPAAPQTNQSSILQPQVLTTTATTVSPEAIEQGKNTLCELQRQNKSCNQLIRFLEQGCAADDQMSPITYLALRKKASKYVMKDGLLCRAITRSTDVLQLPVVPPKLRLEVMKAVHDDKRAGHFGFRKTFGRLRRKYHWDTMCRDVKEYVDGCKVCAEATVCRLAPAGLLIPLRPTTRPFARVGYDKMGPIHRSAAGNEYIYTLTDYCTKTVVGRATQRGRAAEAVSLLEQVINMFGAPQEVITDNGREFINSAFQDLVTAYNIKHLTTAALHPQTNGQTERFNDTVSVVLRKFTNKYQADWDVYLQHAIFAYNTSEHEATSMSPYFLLYGIEPPLEADRKWDPTARRPPDHDFANLEVLPTVREYAAAIVSHKQALEKERYDVGRRQPTFEPGTKVMVRVPQNTGGDGLSARFRMPYIGPFEVVRTTDSNDVIIAGAKRRMKSIININRVKPFTTRRLTFEDSSDTTDQVTENETEGISQLFDGLDQPSGSPAGNREEPDLPAAPYFGPDSQSAPFLGPDLNEKGAAVHQTARRDDEDEATDRPTRLEAIVVSKTSTDETRRLDDCVLETVGIRLRSGRISRPPARLIEVCPILEFMDRVEAADGETVWCMTVEQNRDLIDEEDAGEPTKKEIKLETIGKDGYHAHVFEAEVGTDDLLQQLEVKVGSKLAQQVHDAVQTKSYVAARKQTDGGQLQVALGTVGTTAAPKPASQTEIAGASHEKDTKSQQQELEYTVDTGRRIRNRKGWTTSLKMIDFDSESGADLK